MASGKKAKKPKWKTLALTDFLQEGSGTIPVQPIRKSNINWADEVDEYEHNGSCSNGIKKRPIAGPESWLKIHR
ncbi:hypothetical protein JTB14_015429 [Gonioctena quinquepunctata]|nr:hypothetical protein JTB14_015429 [Gonioctena quinquepunctata]